MATINVEKRGDFYVAFHRDADDLASACEVDVVTLGGARSARFPVWAVEHYIGLVNSAGFDLKFNRPIGF